MSESQAGPSPIEPTQETPASPGEELAATAREATGQTEQAESPTVESPVSERTVPSPASAGPLNLARIRQLRLSQPTPPGAAQHKHRSGRSGNRPKPTQEAEAPATVDSSAAQTPPPTTRVEVGRITPPPAAAPRVAVPSRRAPLSDELERELNQAFAEGMDLDKFLVGDASLQVGHELTEGQRVQARVMKVHDEYVFVSMGGPNEGVLSVLQFSQVPAAGDLLEVIVRGYLPEEGLYELTLPGGTVAVGDWSEIEEGELVEVLVTGSNSGGLECQISNIRGFIPASQISPYRVENTAEFVGQRLLCLITEANQRRGNLVLSRRAVLERERVEQRAQRLAALAVGESVSGTVRKITDFGAFVDLGGVDGLLHISQLSWERVKHPSEVLEEGQQVQVRVDKVDPQSGKISLSYRSLQEHPWNNIQTRFPVGSVVKGTVTRIAEFGAFVKLATGVEGLVHLSELAHYRVQRVGSVVSEGQEVEVKVLSIDEDKQRIGLSLKAAQAPPTDDTAASPNEAQPVETKAVVPKHRGPLKGGTGSNSGGERFGLKW